MPFRVKIVAKLWLFYFLVTIAVIGFSFAVLAFFPLYYLAQWFPVLGRGCDWVLQKGIRLLMSVQPWLDADVAIEIPQVESGVLIVSNHRSHLDVFILLSRIPGIRILAKSTLFRIPFLSLMMRATRQIGVERGRLEAWVKAMETVRRRLLAGETVHIFPEMTRCAPGFDGVQNFASGPFLVAIQERVPVVPLVFKNTDGVWPRGTAGLRFRVPVEVKTLAPIEAAQFKTADELKNEVRRRMQEALA